MALLYACDTPETIEPRFDKFFIKYYGGSGDQYGRDVARTLDGGYILLGTNDPDRSMVDNEYTNDEDMILIKTDSLGNMEWTQIYDVTQKTDIGKAVKPTANGYLIVGDGGERGDSDGIFFETDLMGIPGNFNIIDEGGNEEFENVTSLVDGYIIAGSTTMVKSEQKSDERDYLTIKLFTDLSEDNEWANNNRINGREGADYGINAFPSPDNPDLITVFGYTDKPVDDILIHRGNTFSSLQFDGTEAGNDFYYGDLDKETCAAVAETPGGFLLTGTKEIALNVNEMYYVKTNGVEEVAFPPTSVFSGLNLVGRSITSAVDYKVLYLGEITYVNGNKDIFLGKTDLRGNTMWYETFGDSGQDKAAKVIQNANGSIIFTGTMNLSGQNKIFLIKTNSRGQLNLE